MKTNLGKTYDPMDFEKRIYEEWEKSGAFHAEVDKDKEPFTIVMPPPNITGQLHIGHALDHTYQDVLIRFKRMQGCCVLWLPGTDHASIATEVKVADEIREKEGTTKEELGREEFLKRAWEWKRIYGGKITEQIRRLGDSCDWQRERFTMDEGCNRAVNEYFVRLYKEGLIYKGNRIINWCPVCGTSLSDIEVEHWDESGKYWYFRYPACDGGKGLVIATSRPETMFGDVAVAVNPDDMRYQDMIGKKVILPIVGRELPVIADPYPDPEKGTGAVKITPAHDLNDFEVGQRHDLPKIVCIDFDAKMTREAGKYEGMDRYEAREHWVKELDEAGYLEKNEDMTIPTGRCYRCDTVVEPMISDQWFVKMKPLAEPAIKVVEDKELDIVPERFKNIYLHWLYDIKDWCISRQLWWGHRIPAYYCDKCGEIVVSKEMPEKCMKCGNDKFHQDEDVLDTWFSSALWPFSTLGWPDKTEDLEYFYPTSVLVTAYEIIFFWVIRMSFSGLFIMKERPFDNVLIHGLVRDSEGRKMSKSLGNGVDPLEIIDEYGADALRFTLMNNSTPGNDVRFQPDQLVSSRNFANKLWNASRFVIMNLQDDDGNYYETFPDNVITDIDLKNEDKWILTKINENIRGITANIDKFELSLALHKIYELIWDEFCDWYIELVKERLYSDNDEEKKIVRTVLVYSLSEMLRLLHPFMPFITEEIWSFLDKDTKLISDVWPKYSEEFEYRAEKETIETAMEIIKSIRNIRAETDTLPSKKLTAYIVTKGSKKDQIVSGESHIKKLANVSGITYGIDKNNVPEESVTAVINGAEIFISLEELIDYAMERERLINEIDKLEGDINRFRSKLGNEDFVKKAPEKVVENERQKLADCEEKYEKVMNRLEVIKDK